MTPFRWTRDHLAAITPSAHAAPVIMTRDVPRVAPDLDLWDHWPALTVEGGLAAVEGGLLVVALSAPILPDPEARHAVARLRLFHRTAQRWRDLGPLLPDGFSPGSREWAGSAVLQGPDRRLRLFFTAAGRRGETKVGFEQRLFRCDVELDALLRPVGWSEPAELVRPDGRTYETELEGGGAVGTIKAFRDPFFFRDAVGGDDLLFFAASRAGSPSRYNGLVGAARRQGDRWALLPPLVDATGVNNELERPHAVAHGGRTYLFWSTQAKVFDPDAPPAPTGLYGAVADRVDGPWRPINGHGLVLANPAEAPAQAFSWQVLPDLSVWGFADLVGLDRPPTGPEEARRHFIGAPAPVFRLMLDEERVWLAGGER